MSQSHITGDADLALTSLRQMSNRFDRELTILNRFKDEMPDSWLAIELYIEELDQKIIRMRDRLTARGIFGAGQINDGGGVADFAPVESGAGLGDELEGTNRTLSLATSAELRNCISCGESAHHHNIAQTPCDHLYCRACLQTLFKLALQVSSLFPPRCCNQPILPHLVRSFLTPALLQQYSAKEIEHATADPTYCASCSTFIPVVNTDTDEHVRCPLCELVTCTMCKGKAHMGDCPADKDLQVILGLADEQGWRRCNGCKAVVERDEGCNHITCRCGSQFCYKCGDKWKTCECDQWDQDLPTPAEVAAARAREVWEQRYRQRLARHYEATGRAIGFPLFQIPFTLVVHYWRRARSECEHAKWKSFGGHHQCEVCRGTLTTYIFMCAQCHLRACRRCRRKKF